MFKLLAFVLLLVVAVGAAPLGYGYTVGGYYPAYYDPEIYHHNPQLSHFGYRPAAYVAVDQPHMLHTGLGGYDAFRHHDVHFSNF